MKSRCDLYSIQDEMPHSKSTTSQTLIGMPENKSSASLFIDSKHCKWSGLILKRRALRSGQFSDKTVISMFMQCMQTSTHDSYSTCRCSNYTKSIQCNSLHTGSVPCNTTSQVITNLQVFTLNDYTIPIFNNFFSLRISPMYSHTLYRLI